MAKVNIYIEGGVVVHAESDIVVELEILDYDTEGYAVDRIETDIFNMDFVRRSINTVVIK